MLTSQRKACVNLYTDQASDADRQRSESIHTVVGFENKIRYHVVNHSPHLDFYDTIPHGLHAHHFKVINPGDYGEESSVRRYLATVKIVRDGTYNDQGRLFSWEHPCPLLGVYRSEYFDVKSRSLWNIIMNGILQRDSTVAAYVKNAMHVPPGRADILMQTLFDTCATITTSAEDYRMKVLALEQQRWDPRMTGTQINALFAKRIFFACMVNDSGVTVS